jgi:hypothetical protein
MGVFYTSGGVDGNAGLKLNSMLRRAMKPVIETAAKNAPSGKGGLAALPRSG